VNDPQRPVGNHPCSFCNWWSLELWDSHPGRRHQLVAHARFVLERTCFVESNGGFLTPFSPVIPIFPSSKMAGGTGQKFEAAATWTAGVASIAATLLSIVYEFPLPRSIPRSSPSAQVLTRFFKQVNMVTDVRILHMQFQLYLLTATKQQKLSQTATPAICRPHPAHVRIVHSTLDVAGAELCLGSPYIPSPRGPAWFPRRRPPFSIQSGTSTRYCLSRQTQRTRSSPL
jgi:hypothetical protein